ncbi:uncharacterized protein LOC126265815 [Aethina tumida]|uniref:uncharacterized protein LOC126265815 n=1 Tax=Aethina tumida TaxID=116153 RepID=UPI0021489E8C|nr:uncharacterized protein LOC126265815 [Aethina tumida]
MQQKYIIFLAAALLLKTVSTQIYISEADYNQCMDQTDKQFRADRNMKVKDAEKCLDRCLMIKSKLIGENGKVLAGKWQTQLTAMYGESFGKQMASCLSKIPVTKACTVVDSIDRCGQAILKN